MTTPVRHLLLCALAATLPLAATAQEARTAKPVNLRAGPARDYPLVANYGPGAPIAVQGCTSGYGWCDVIGPDGARGWIYGANIVYPYQNQDVPILGYGAAIGLPIVGFALGSYWGTYYRNRPWYGDRGRWDHRPVYRPGPSFTPPARGAPPRPIGGRPAGGGPQFGGGGPGRPPGGGIGQPQGGGIGRPPPGGIGASHGAPGGGFHGGAPGGGFHGGGPGRGPGGGGYGGAPGGGGHGGGPGGGGGGHAGGGPHH